MTERLIDTKVGINNSAENINLQKSEVQFTTNPTLDAICDALASAPPDWEYLTEMASDLASSSLLQAGQIQGRLGEVYVTHLLDSITSSDDFRDHCNNTPLKRARMQFRRKNGSLIAVDPNNPKIHLAEYDDVRRIGDLLTVFEIKTGTQNTGDTSLVDTLKEENIKARFGPLQKFYPIGTRFGYVVVGLPDAINPVLSIKEEFKSKGGKLVAINMPREKLKGVVEAVRN